MATTTVSSGKLVRLRKTDAGFEYQEEGTLEWIEFAGGGGGGGGDDLLNVAVVEGSYSLTSALDSGTKRFLVFTNGGSRELHISDDGAEYFETGTVISGVKIDNSGDISVTWDNVDMYSAGGYTITEQGSHFSLIKIGPNAWSLSGHLS